MVLPFSIGSIAVGSPTAQQAYSADAVVGLVVLADGISGAADTQER